MDGKEKRLNQIFTEIKQLDPSILPDLNAMIRLYSQAQLVIGHLDADALYRYGEAYTKRKSAYAEAIENGHGTGAEKEAQAQLVSENFRLIEWETKAESRKSSNLFNPIDNLIIAVRRDERIAMAVHQKVNDIYEGS